VSSAVRKNLRNKPFTVFYAHATGFSQWLMAKFLSAEFIWRLGVFDWRVVLQYDRKFGRQRKSAAF